MATTTVIEQCKISPPSDVAGEFYIRIVFFDMMWYEFPAVHQVFFFDFPANNCSKLHFLEAIVPNLKRSLSQTLSHFLPMAGNIIHPVDSTRPGGAKPIIRYLARDSVSFTVSESTADFIHLSGYHPRDSDEFYAFVPSLPPAVHSEHSIACPVLAVQATIFPGQGVCISSVVHHVAADANTIASFMQAWALIHSITHNIGGEDGNVVSTDYISNRLMGAKCLPFYDRQMVMDINGLDSIYWDMALKNSFAVEPPPLKFPIKTIRTTFVLGKEEIKRLKNSVLIKRIEEIKNRRQPSSFSIACALAWVCSAKSAAASGEGVVDDELEYFNFLVDCRGRVNPLLPANYFGNCLAVVSVKLRHGELKGDDGFITAVESIENAIHDRVYGEKGILHGAERWLEDKEKFVEKRAQSVVGSSKFDFCAVDFGWGKPKKVEMLNIDGSRNISLSKSTEYEGGLEIGLSKTKLQMEAFTAVFNQLLTQPLPPYGL